MARKAWATESFGSRVNDKELSMEEEAIDLQEGEEARVEADQLANDGEQATAISDALEDLAEVADTIPEASATDVALVDTAARLATAGTDTDPEELVPSQESYVGRKMSTEGIREIAKKVWEAIKKICKQIWEKVEKFFYKVVGTIPNLRKRLEALKKRADAKNGSTAENKKITITTGCEYLQVDFQRVTDENALKGHVEKLKKVVDHFSEAYVSDLVAAGDAVRDALNDFSGDNGGKVVGGLVNTITKQKIFDISRVGIGFGTSVTTGNRSERKSDGLLGNRSLYLKNLVSANMQAGTANVLKYAELQRQNCFSVSSSDPTGKKKSVDEVQFTTMTPSGVEDFCNLAIEIIDKIEDYERGSAFKKVKKTADDIVKASDKAEAAMNKAKGGDAAEKAQVAYYRALINYNLGYAKWVKSPLADLSALAMTTIRAIMSVADKSLAEYK